MPISWLPTYPKQTGFLPAAILISSIPWPVTPTWSHPLQSMGQGLGGGSPSLWSLFFYSKRTAWTFHLLEYKDYISQPPLKLGMAMWYVPPMGCEEKWREQFLGCAVKRGGRSIPFPFFPASSTLVWKWMCGRARAVILAWTAREGLGLGHRPGLLKHKYLYKNRTAVSFEALWFWPC